LSARGERAKRQEERQRTDATSGDDRRRRLLQLAAGTAFLVVAVVLVLIVASSGGSGGDAGNIGDKAEVDRLLSGIPQQGMVLGDPKAPVALIEFGDLQCPVCAGYAKEILPPIIENQVKKGQVKIDFRNYTIIGEQSTPAGAAALAAGAQGRGWNYVELFYRNQGEENSGYADNAFLTAIAEGAGVQNLTEWKKERDMLIPEVEKSTGRAQELGFTGTPGSTGEIEEAIEKAR
jgi:protein-disulfide isomerase